MAKRNSRGKPPAKTAVGYVRMSSGEQEKSPERQRAEIKALAKREGLNLIRWYEDHAVAGWKSQERGGFQQLIADAETLGDFELVICDDQDHFSRFEPMEANFYWFRLKTAGVGIISAAQGVNDDIRDPVNSRRYVRHDRRPFLRQSLRRILDNAHNLSLSRAPLEVAFGEYCHAPF